MRSILALSSASSFVICSASRACVDSGLVEPSRLPQPPVDARGRPRGLRQLAVPPLVASAAVIERWSFGGALDAASRRRRGASESMLGRSAAPPAGGSCDVISSSSSAAASASSGLARSSSCRPSSALRPWSTTTILSDHYR